MAAVTLQDLPATDGRTRAPHAEVRFKLHLVSTVAQTLPL